jgi:hypothetical protein
MQSHTISCLKNVLNRLFNGDQVVGRLRPAHHQEYCSDILIFLRVALLRIWLHLGRLDYFTSAVSHSTRALIRVMRVQSRENMEWDVQWIWNEICCTCLLQRCFPDALLLCAAKLVAWHCVCAWWLRLAGVWCGLLASLLLCLCLPFLSCLPPLTCVSGLTGSDVSYLGKDYRREIHTKSRQLQT